MVSGLNKVGGTGGCISVSLPSKAVSGRIRTGCRVFSATYPKPGSVGSRPSKVVQAPWIKCQLNIWSVRAGADIVRRDKADPASVVYEAIQKARNENYDVILVDTAGRLQNKFNLMEELKKLKQL